MSYVGDFCLDVEEKNKDIFTIIRMIIRVIFYFRDPFVILTEQLIINYEFVLAKTGHTL